MIKVTKEILENIGIENLFLSGKKEREKWLLHPIEMEYSYWAGQTHVKTLSEKITESMKF